MAGDHMPWKSLKRIAGSLVSVKDNSRTHMTLGWLSHKQVIDGGSRQLL